ncbi:MAG: hypothetical protein NTW62_03480 [Candidatus Nomurabacteria bacterium]|nr:hypothetical protein [Candidatus Nomurabacteria bacterium]
MDIFKVIKTVENISNNVGESSSQEKSSNFGDIVLYFLYYFLLIGLIIALYSFLIFSFGGILGFVFWLVSVVCFNSIAAGFVFRDVKRNNLRGVDVKNTPFGWAGLTFTFSIFGLSAYLAVRKVALKIKTTNQTILHE